MDRSFLAVVFAFLFGTVLIVEAHVFKTGNCPNVEVMESFDYNQFKGVWYAIEKSNTLSSCMKYDFLLKDDGSKEVLENYRFFGIQILDLTNFSQTGKLSVPDESIPAKMLVQFPFSLNPFTPASFWVMSTDYENYAAVWSCRRFLFGHFQSAMILSRKRTLDRHLINKMRSRFQFYGIDMDDLSVVEQWDCPTTVEAPTEEEDLGEEDSSATNGTTPASTSTTPEAATTSSGFTTSSTSATSSTSTTQFSENRTDPEAPTRVFTATSTTGGSVTDINTESNEIEKRIF